MLTLRRPSDDEIQAHLESLRGSAYSYKHVGATLTHTPAGFQHDAHRVPLGHGAGLFAAAKQAIQQWQMFPDSMLSLHTAAPHSAPFQVDQIVAVLFKAACLWSLNPCRIVYSVDETVGDVARYGFAYGTLPDHLECGEELFLVEHHLTDDSVWYELSCFSRPKHPLAWLGYPYARYQQARFRRLSGDSMQAAVSEKPCSV